MIALLGRADYPTDGVNDYCQMLSAALAVRDCELNIIRISWQTGRLKSLIKLWRELRGQTNRWVLLQYTALAWSRRGFPALVVVLLGLLRLRKARIAIIFHDSAPYHGQRFVDRVRRFFQLRVMNFAYRIAEKSIFPVPLHLVPWLPANRSKAFFIPAGSNVPATVSGRSSGHDYKSRTIAVFGITGDGSGGELSDISFVARAAAARLPGIRLMTCGRGSAESEIGFRQNLEGSAVEYSALGLLPANEVASALSGSDVALFVRGPVCTQRTSAIASIACGIPLVAYSQSPMPSELSEAGVVGVTVGDRDALAQATIQVLSDDTLWQELHCRSLLAFEKTFSWPAIASQFAQVLADA